MVTLGLLTGCVVLVPADWTGTDQQEGTTARPTQDALDVTIRELQQGEVTEGTWVQVTGIAAHDAVSEGLFLQDGGPEAWSGLWVDAMDADLPTFSLGDEIAFTGTYTEHNGFTTLFVGPDDDATWVSGGHVLAAPTILVPELFAVEEDLEPYEGMLVELQDLVIVNHDPDSASFVVQLSTGDTLRVGDELYGFQDLDDELIERLSGLLAWQDMGWRLMPRGEGDAVFTAPPEEGKSVYELWVGDLIITEVMANPDGCSDTTCEWIEILNTSPDTIDLHLLEVYDQQGNDAVVDDNVLLEPGGLAMLAFTDQASWPLTEVQPDAFLGNTLRLPNQATSLVLAPHNSATQLDWITWAAVDAQPGIALQLDPDSFSDALNDLTTAWCPALTAISGSPDRGTPGDPNHDC